MWIVGAIIAIFILWHFLPQPKPRQPSPHYQADWEIDANERYWQAIISKRSESPAETAFLSAMIGEFGLRPQGHSLMSTGIKLDMQVGEGQYRADFLANDWLVIEIDGEAYHSSPEAKRKDALRDMYFEDLGYAVVRIPAKIVFQSPSVAIETVRAALAKGRPQRVLPPQQRGLDRLRETARSVANGIKHIDRIVTQKMAIDEALRSARSAASTEKLALDYAISDAIRKSNFTAASDRNKEIYESFEVSIRKGFSEKGTRLINLPEFPSMPTHDDPEIAALIETSYIIITAERENRIQEARAVLNKYPVLRISVQENLSRLGCPQLWNLIQ